MNQSSAQDEPNRISLVAAMRTIQPGFGDGRVCVNNAVMQELGIGEGAFVEIRGRWFTVATAWSACAEDQGQRIVRVDDIIRSNAGAVLNEQV